VGVAKVNASGDHARKQDGYKYGEEQRLGLTALLPGLQTRKQHFAQKINGHRAVLKVIRPIKAGNGPGVQKSLDFFMFFLQV